MRIKAKVELDMEDVIWLRYALKELIRAPHGLSDGEIAEIQILYAKVSSADYDFVKEEDE